MPKAYASTVIEAPAERVWAAVRDFGELPTWSGLVESSELEGGRAGDRVGCVRVLALPDGGVIRERLVALSDAERTQSYTIVEAPVPVSEYSGTLRVTPVTDGERSFVEWWGTFECDLDQREHWVTFFSGLYQQGFDALKAYAAP
jgi:hypothetical protein